MLKKPLAFTNSGVKNGLTDADLRTYVKAVDNDVKSVVESLIAEIEKENPKLRAASSDGPNNTVVITVDDAHQAADFVDELGQEIVESPGFLLIARITFVVSTAHIPAIINAAARFFSNFRTVFGLVTVTSVSSANFVLLGIGQKN